MIENLESEVLDEGISEQLLVHSIEVSWERGEHESISIGRTASLLLSIASGSVLNPDFLEVRNDLWVIALLQRSSGICGRGGRLVEKPSDSTKERTKASLWVILSDMGLEL